MRVFTEQITPTATVTAYVQAPSERLSTARRRPAVLVIPGGGYMYTSDRESEPVALAYLAAGFNAIVLRYAADETMPIETAFADGRAALAWVRAHADDLAIDASKVAAVGFSAGGNLAARLGAAGQHRPDALVLGYPVTLPRVNAELDVAYPDVTADVDARTPATFVWATGGDALVPVQHTLALCQALAEHHVPFESHVYLIGPHGLSLAVPATANGDITYVDEAAQAWLGDSVRFLRRVFGDFAVYGEPNTVATRGRRAFPDGPPA